MPVLLAALGITAIKSLEDKDEEKDSDKLDPLELSSADASDTIVLESEVKSCKVCKSGNIM